MKRRPGMLATRMGWMGWLLLQGMALPALCAEAPPSWRNVAIVAVQGWNGWRGDLGTADQPLSAALPDYLAKRTGIAQLAGLDGERGAFVALRTDGITLAPVAVIPVNDAEALFVSLRAALGEVELLRPGVWKLGRREWTAFALERDGWLYVAQTEALLQGDCRPDPAEIFQQVGGKHDLAIMVDWQNLPEVYRSWAVDRHREAVLAKRASLGEAGRGPLGVAAADALVERLLLDLDRLALGWNYTAGGEAELTFSFRAKTGSPLALLQQGLGASRLPLAGWMAEGALAQEKAQSERCLLAELNLELTPEGAALVQQIFVPKGGNGERPAVGDWLQQALLALCQGKLQGGVSIQGRRPPAAVTWSVAGGDLADWRLLLARTLGGFNEAGAAREPAPVAPLVVDSQAGASLPVWQLPLDDSDTLKNLAGPGCEGLVVDRGGALHGVVAAKARERLQGRLSAVSQAADDAGTPEQGRLFRAEARMAGLLRLFSIAADDWETKALLGKLTLVIVPEHDQLRCTCDRDGEELRLRVVAGRGLTQAAALGLTLLLIQ